MPGTAGGALYVDAARLDAGDHAAGLPAIDAMLAFAAKAFNSP